MGFSNFKELYFDVNGLKKLYFGDNLAWEKYSYDYYISTTGSDTNDGKTPETAFASVSALADVIENGDSVFIESGTYTLTSSTTLSKAITLESSEEDPATFMINNEVYWGLIFNLQEESGGLTINLNNIYFDRKGSGDACGLRMFLGSNVDGNYVNVNNCSFNGFRRRWAGGAFEIYSESPNNEILVTNSSFTNNTAYNYGHLGSSLTVTGHYGKMRVYNCIFNNPSGDSMKFCGTKGRAVGGIYADDTVYLDLKGSCNQFLGSGDSCFKNYTEEECSN